MIENLSEIIVNSKEEILEIIRIGNSTRTTHSTASNEGSSRSHAICSIILIEND
jgi:kinesin family protein 2/24